MSSGELRLSAILVIDGNFEGLRRVVSHLRGQSLHDQIEIVIVTPSIEKLDPDPSALEGFHSVQIVETGAFETAGKALAAGVRAANAHVVVYVEEHSFPAAGWAEALVRAHEGPWAAVGPAMTNANPESIRSWTSFLLDFAAWLAPAEAGAATILAAHQTSYKRELLLRYAEALDEILETEATLQQDLRAQGHQLYFEPAAVTSHVNISRFRSILRLQFHSYRALAGNRVRDGRWSSARRLLYVIGSPLIPFVRGARIHAQLRRRGLGGSFFVRVLPTLMPGLISGTLGEVVGYGLGSGDSPHQRLAFEIDRMSFVTDEDRTRLLSEKS